MPSAPRFPAASFSSPSRSITPGHLITVASALRLGQSLNLRCSRRVQLLICSAFQDGYQSGHFFGIKEFWIERAYLLKRESHLKNLAGALSLSCSSCFAFFSRKHFGKVFASKRNLQFKTSEGKPFDGRLWTNVLLALNVLAYISQIATQGKLILWGAKHQAMLEFCLLSKISDVTNHVPLNLFEVGSAAVFALRHRSLFAGARQDIQQIAHVIAINMVIGSLSKSIDNWGHLGGLLGGAAMSWFLGPAWSSSKLLRCALPKEMAVPPFLHLLLHRRRADPNKQKHLVLYTKRGCCPCDGLKRKLHAALSLGGPHSLHSVNLQIRDMSENPNWERLYQYEIPVLARALPDGTEVASSF
ncbi:hypothetical protein J5N97_009316 [Dioscorea zingiberensis]|uniref:Peptidase S54 rhomboid domain-containing protein n=1 Tax=Dioscorea zingiberensis TaxID=325984 RepID=A0A9D5HLV3_9LILI|nr:hypothetical protein J5N97_009316 [Dioscorea zingiberensis]